MSRAATSAAYFQRNKARIYARRNAKGKQDRAEAANTRAAIWLIQEVLNHYEPPQPVNYFRPMPVRRPLLTLKRR